MTEDIALGQIVAGKYRVENMLGQGGMGVVVGARHIKLDEPVAIKLLRPAMLQVEGMVSRFLREARAASKIKSPHVVRVTDVDVLPDGVPYMVMEHLTGIDFFDLRAERGALGVTESVGYLLQACDAIAEAHTLGIVHRDLKPSNLFLHRRPDGKETVKVLDFGLSKVDGPSEMEATRSGQVLGSPKYMSPEQMLATHEVDRRADIWSLGVILYELVTGQSPFAGDTTPRLCAQVLNAEPPRPSSVRPDLPPEIDALILRCLQKDRTQRFADVGELVAALMPFAPPEMSIRRTVASPRLSTTPSPPSILGERPPAKLRSVTPAPVTVGPPSSPLAALAAEDKPTAILPAEIAAPAPISTAPKAPGRARIAVVMGGAALVAGLGALYATRGGAREAVPDRVAVAATASPSAAPAAPAPKPPAEPERPALKLDELPDATATAAVSAAPKALPVSGGGAVAKKARAEPKPKPEPSSDPFGGRRH